MKKRPSKTLSLDDDDEFSTHNLNFSFADRDIKLRDFHGKLRRIAVGLFVLSIALSVILIVDIEVTREARQLVAAELHCEDTYVHGWARYCQPLIDGINFTVNKNTEYFPVTYFQRWIAIHLQVAYVRTVAGIILKALISFITLVMLGFLIYYQHTLFTIKRVRRAEVFSELLFCRSPKLRLVLLEMIFTCFHIPPTMDAWIPYEYQIIAFFRLCTCGVKFLKEVNEFRYHRLGNVLFRLARIKVKSSFIFRTHFRRHPRTVLVLSYVVVVGFFSYVAVVAEHTEGFPLSYLDACWLMVVSITNLGSGEVRPHGVPARVMVGLASLIGVLSTAMWVNVFSKYLDLPMEERRILTLIEVQNCRRMERNAAAAYIQSFWKRYTFLKKSKKEKKNNNWKKRVTIIEKKCDKIMWRWKATRQQYNQIRRDLQMQFPTEDTLIVAQRVERKLNRQSEIREENERRRSSMLAKESPTSFGSLFDVARRSYHKFRTSISIPNKVDAYDKPQHQDSLQDVENREATILPTSSQRKREKIRSTLESLSNDVARLMQQLLEEQKRSTVFQHSVLTEMHGIEKSLRNILSPDNSNIDNSAKVIQ